MATRNFVIARTEEEALAMAADSGSCLGIGFETIEEAQRNLENIKGLVQFLPPSHGGTDYHIFRIVRQVVLVG